MDVSGNETHDFKIGNAEVYNLFVTEENDNLIITFRPMVLPTIKKIEKIIDIKGEKYLLLDIQPNIIQEDLTVLINGDKIPVVSVESDYEKIINIDKKIALIIYKVKIKKPERLKINSLLILEYQTNGQYKTCSQGRTYFKNK